MISTIHKLSKNTWAVLTLIAILAVYVGLYFAVLALPPAIRLPQALAYKPPGIRTKFIEVNGEWRAYPDYRGLPDWIFAPIHQVDRTRLRPEKWGGRSPRNQELSFDWLMPALA